MKITFDLKAQISVPDADFMPEKKKLEEMLAKLLEDEGMRVRNLSVENYTVDGKPTGESHEIKRERFVVMRKNRTEIWAGLSKHFSFRKLDDLKEVAIKTYRSEKQAETCSSWDRDFEVVPVTEIIRFKVGTNGSNQSK